MLTPKFRFSCLLTLTIFVLSACASPATPTVQSTQAAPTESIEATAEATADSVEPTAETVEPTAEPVATDGGETTSEPLPEGSYEMGAYKVTNIWVDAQKGSDANTGFTADDPLQTLTAAWERIPQGEKLTTGYVVNLAPGTYPESALPNYLEMRYGAADAPVVFQATAGPGTVTLGGDLSFFDVSYVYLLDLNIVPDPPGDVIHCEKCDHFLMRNLVLDGGDRQAHETVKINQSQHVYIEGSDIFGADDNAIDFVAVQYGHLINNRIHDAQDWCVYAKGGSAFLTYAGNEIFDCGVGGFTAGQGTGFQFMTPPYLRYETYGIRVINNVIHDTEGAGLGVNGSYNVLMAFNTLYRVGQRSHLVEFVYGARSCDGVLSAGDPVDERCAEYLAQGGWGTTTQDGGDTTIPIPNKNIFFFNNVIYNPAPFRSEYQQFSVAEPRTEVDSATNLPSTVMADDNLQIVGNIIWNGPAEMLLGIEDTGACTSENATCNADQLRADNQINTAEPQLADPENGDYSLASEAEVAPIPDFTWDDAPELTDIPDLFKTNTLDQALPGVASPQ